MPDEKCYACRHVLSARRPVLYVCREDGDLIFACGSSDHEQSTDDWKVIHRGHLIDVDESLSPVMDLENDQQAVRSALGEPWVRGPLSD